MSTANHSKNATGDARQPQPVISLQSAAFSHNAHRKKSLIQTQLLTQRKVMTWYQHSLMRTEQMVEAAENATAWVSPCLVARLRLPAAVSTKTACFSTAPTCRL